MIPFILNRAITNRDATTNTWRMPADGFYHIMPFGEQPHNESGLLQVLDPIAAQSILANFKSETSGPNPAFPRIDYDHFSYDPSKPSEAAGWVVDLENRGDGTKAEDGLWAKIKWTPEGEHAVKNGNYRYISPVWMRKDTQDIGQGKIRPLRMDSAGITNSPQLTGMVALSNRQGDTPPTQTVNKKEKSMKSIATFLGLAAEASEDSVLAEVKKIMNRVTGAETALSDATKTGKAAVDEAASLKNRVTELETAMAGIKATADESPALKNRITELQTLNTELTTTVVESDLNEFSSRFKPESRDTWKAQLIANRKGTRGLLESLTPVPTMDAAGKPILNRNAGQQPPADKEFPAMFSDYIAANPTVPKAKAIDAVRLANREKYEAWKKVGGNL